MCQPARVVNRYGLDVADRFGIPEAYNVPGPGGVFLGSVGDQAHSTRRSSHNCAGAPGGQESPVNGVAYHPDYAHAWDARPASHDLAMEMVRATLADPRCRYVIYDSVGYKPDGSTWSTYHPTFHVSFLPGTHDDTRPFFADQGGLTVAEVKDIIDAIKAQTDTLTGVIRRNADRAIATSQRQGLLTRAALARLEKDPELAKALTAEADKIPADESD